MASRGNLSTRTYSSDCGEGWSTSDRGRTCRWAVHGEGSKQGFWSHQWSCKPCMLRCGGERKIYWIGWTNFWSLLTPPQLLHVTYINITIFIYILYIIYIYICKGTIYLYTYKYIYIKNVCTGDLKYGQLIWVPWTTLVWIFSTQLHTTSTREQKNKTLCCHPLPRQHSIYRPCLSSWDPRGHIYELHPALLIPQ